jgi:hypothetical protein
MQIFERSLDDYCGQAPARERHLRIDQGWAVAVRIFVASKVEGTGFCFPPPVRWKNLRKSRRTLA